MAGSVESDILCIFKIYFLIGGKLFYTLHVSVFTWFSTSSNVFKFDTIYFYLPLTLQYTLQAILDSVYLD